MPDATTCAYGGNGGSPITEYLIEWDTKFDFSSPADRSVLTDLSELAFEIGGRDIMTGEESTLLERGTEYYVRVAAINAQGVGPFAATVEPSAVTADRVPLDPEAAEAVVLSSTSLLARWGAPMSDGGLTLESFMVEWDTNENFTTKSYEEFAVVPEVQAITVDTPVVNEVQSIRATVEVTNERQTVRTVVDGVDEVQTITTTCDDVQAEVQTVATSATDTDEEQTFSLQVHTLLLLLPFPSVARSSTLPTPMFN